MTETTREYTKYLEGIVSPQFRAKTILTVGVGAGSYAVEKMARLHPRRLKLCDFDAVTIPNLGRTAYEMEDALNHRLKVDALKKRIIRVNPDAEVVMYPDDLLLMSQETLSEMFSGVDLVIAGTDNFRAQVMLNEEAFARNIPAVFIGFHEGIQGGRIVWCVPDLTPCYSCVAHERFTAADNGEDMELNLPGESGLIFDCQFIDMVAMKIGVAILERGQDSAMGRFFTSMGVRNDVVVRCSPDYEWGQALWEALLADLPKRPKDYAQELRDQAFLTMDTLWFKGEWDPACPVCGGVRTK